MDSPRRGRSWPAHALRLGRTREDDRWFERARADLEWLLAHPSEGMWGLPRGQPYDWPFRVIIPTGTPRATVTPIALMAFLEARDLPVLGCATLKWGVRVRGFVPQTVKRPSPRRSDPVSPLDKEALKQLALLGGIVDHVELSSSEFAGLIDASQQTASRRILDLVSQGFLEREMGVKKQLLKVSNEGLEVLKEEAAAYRRIFELSRSVHIHGIVSSGVGEGQYYISQEGYSRQFDERLGYVPFAGTLNLELQGPEVNKLRLLRANPGILIERFSTPERTFGEVYCWRAKIGSEPCAAILPKRSHYTRVLEVIAPEHLRSRLGLEDGDEVELEVEVPG